MYEKLKEFSNKIFLNSSTRCIFFLSIIWFIVVSYFEWENKAFYYPEKEYQILENEAITMVRENKVEHESNYECIIDYYNIKSKELVFRLIDSDYTLYRHESNSKFTQSAPLYVKVHVENYKAINKDIKIERMENKFGHIRNEIVVIIIIPIILAIVTWCTILLVIEILLLVLKIFNIIFLRTKHKK